MANEHFVPALIVIDMQNDFISGSLAVPGASQIIAPINFLLALDFKLKVGTRDWHIPFASNHDGKNVFEKITIFPPTKLLKGEGNTAEDLGLEQVLWPPAKGVSFASSHDRKDAPHGGEDLVSERVLWHGHCIAGTEGAKFVEDLEVKHLQVVISKGKDDGECYSAFCDRWNLTTTDLPKTLHDSGVTDVFLVGVASDYCVKYTAIDAVRFGFKAWVVKDAVRSVARRGREWGEMESAGVGFIEKSEEVAEILKRAVSLGS
ncbi:Isochorismatase hydrolase [Leucogyrophana mollusca]|uniref:Isochorismatase hydrolase n=1 Tax=Leucogyrophana mollusca TaxID=85980 RepID=A0ACB8B5W6_9AGAM|nr:Isochorismatase hydrolase [Leucogyrophana mollusca]